MDIDSLKAENDRLYTKLSDYEKLTSKSLTLKLRLAEIERLREENFKLKHKLIKFDQLNVKGASYESSMGIIDDLKNQLKHYHALINEVNILKDRIKYLEEIITKDNHLKIKMKDFEKVINENSLFKTQIKEYSKIMYDNQILNEQNLIANEENSELKSQIIKLKLQIAQLHEENLKEQYELPKLKEEIIKLKEEENKELVSENVKLSEDNIKILEHNLLLLKENTQLNIDIKKLCTIPILISEKNSWKGINIDMIFNDNYIYGINNDNIKFNILYFDKNNIKNTYYIQNVGNLNETFMLQLYDRKFHYLNEDKTKKEYDLLSEYFMKFYYYGYLKIGLYEYNYIITKTYDSNVLIHNLSNNDKYKFLMNNLNFLNKLQKNNMIYKDYKFENIAWDSEMNLILINYNLESLQSISKDIDKDKKKEKNIFNMSDEMLLKFFKIDVNEYGKINGEINDKISVGRLKELIDILNIQYTDKFINKLPLPANELIIVSKRRIGKLSPITITSNLNLDIDNINYIYDDIPIYDELIKVFEWLYENKYIKD
jgi:hypothetical protein